MKADPSYLLRSLSSNDVTFFIPPYQRNYEWSTDICKVLMADVKRTAQSNLAGEKTEHFFGSIVYVVEETGFGIPDRYILTDGQQRITTTMLFLMALRDSIEDEDYRSYIQSRYLQNERAGDDTEYKIKLKQVETDWEAYKALALGMEVPGELKNSAVYRNYQFFLKALRGLSEEEKKSYLEEGVSKLSIIAIQLQPDKNPWENPQEIFESMNSLGMPLSLADLVRNYLLMGKSSKEQTKLYNEYWLQLEHRLPGRLSGFIRDWMQADQHRSYKVARENNYKELYSQFKIIVEGRSVAEIFEDFVRFSKPYSYVAQLAPTGNPKADLLIDDLNIIGVNPAYSYLAELLGAWTDGRLSSSDVVGLLTAMRNYLLRRRVLGITQAENKTIPTLGLRLEELTRSSAPAEKLLEQLSSYEYAMRLPNDGEFKAALETVNFYNLGRSRNYPKLILSLAEERLTKARPDWEDKHLQFEHIMPQTLSERWLDELGYDAENVHQEYINNIGNLTLIRHNQELGNRSFSQKKKVYSSNSGLQITQNRVLDRDRWDEDAIARRRDYMVDLIVNHVLPLSDEFKDASNWRQVGTGAKFSSKEVLNSLIGETIAYAPNPSVTAKVVNDSEVEFEGAYWRLSPLTRELKRREGVANQSGAYQGSLYWEWDGMRLVDIGS